MVNQIKNWQPDKVFLFSGHMIDTPDRKIPRFPPEKETLAAAAITKRLNDLGASQKDLAICSGACGGDLLFAEACLQLNLHLDLWLPFEIPQFLESSVNFAGKQWQQRFYAVTEHPNTVLHIMPNTSGAYPEAENPYAKNNLWMLHSALSQGLEKVYFICLWNGQGGDGDGGTQHMYHAVKQKSANLTILNTQSIFQLPN